MYSCGQSIYSVRFPFFSLPLFVLPSFFLLFLHSSRFFCLCSSFSFQPYSFYSSPSFLFSLSCSLPPFIIFSFFYPFFFFLYPFLLFLICSFFLPILIHSTLLLLPFLLSLSGFFFLFYLSPSFVFSFLISSIFQPSFLFYSFPCFFSSSSLLFYSFLFSPFHPYSSSIRSLFCISFFHHSFFISSPEALFWVPVGIQPYPNHIGNRFVPLQCNLILHLW